VAAEAFGHLLVGVAFEIETESVALERRETGAEAKDEALPLLRRDDAHDGIVDSRPWKRVSQGAVAVFLTRRSVAERHVGVQRRVLEARGRLDRRDDLPRDAELGEARERGLLVGPTAAYPLVEPDESFLDEVVGFAAGDEVRA